MPAVSSMSALPSTLCRAIWLMFASGLVCVGIRSGHFGNGRGNISSCAAPSSSPPSSSSCVMHGGCSWSLTGGPFARLVVTAFRRSSASRSVCSDCCSSLCCGGWSPCCLGGMVGASCGWSPATWSGMVGASACCLSLAYFCACSSMRSARFLALSALAVSSLCAAFLPSFTRC